MKIENPTIIESVKVIADMDAASFVSELLDIESILTASITLMPEKAEHIHDKYTIVHDMIERCLR